MNWRKVLQWVTFILNLIVYFAVINLVLLLVLRVVSMLGVRNSWLAWGLYILLDALALYFLARHLFREIVLASPDKRKECIEQPSRTVTALRYLALTILGAMLLLVGLKLIGRFDLFYAGWPLLLFPAAATAAVILGVLRPKKRGSNLSVSLLACGLLLEIPGVLVVLPFLTMMPTRFEYRTSELRPGRYFALSAEHIQRSFPPEAKKCRIRGDRGFSTTFYWSCECSETEFLRFARRNSYEIRKHDIPAHGGRHPENIIPFEILRKSGLDRKPESFYFHNERWANGGGWTLLYDRKTHILYGNYANR